MVKLLTTYQTGIEDTNKTAKIFFDTKNNEYTVSVKNDMGTSFTTQFETLEKAELFAQGWINEHTDTTN
jgi:hypothetical protein